LLIAQTKVINETFFKLFAVNAQPYFKKPWFVPNKDFQASAGKVRRSSCPSLNRLKQLICLMN
jgi:hypothetical protein